MYLQGKEREELKMMNTIKFDVEQAIKGNVEAITRIIADYYDEEGFEMDAQELNEVRKILKNIQIRG